MKELFAVAALTIVLLGNSIVTSTTFDDLNFYFNPWEREFVDDYNKQEALDNWNDGSQMFDNVTTSDPRFNKYCSATCPLPTSNDGRVFRKKQLTIEENYLHHYKSHDLRIRN